MKIIKGVFTYLLIMLGIVAIAGVLLFAAMAFLHVPMFGMNVIMHNSLDKGATALNEFSELKWEPGTTRLIEINSNNYDVNIRANAGTLSDSKTATAELFNGGFGLSTNGIASPEVTVRYYNSRTAEKYNFITSKDYTSAVKIVIDINTPQGLIAYKDSKLNLNLPYSGYKYDFVINSGEGDVKIYPATNPVSSEKEYGNLEVNSLAITTTKGNVSVSGLKENSGVLKLSSLELKTETGKFDFSEHKEIETSSNVVKIEGVRGDFKFSKYNGKFAIKGENLVFDADYINTKNGEFLYNCPNGTIMIDVLNVGDGVAQIVTEYAKVDIMHLIGDTSIQATYGATNIKNTYANVVDVTTTHGNITIDNATKNKVTIGYNPAATTLAEKYPVSSGSGEYNGTIALRSRYGDILVKAYETKGWFTNINGRINVKQNATGDRYETKIETVKGTVVAENLVGIVNATNTGSANMTIAFAKLVAKTGSEADNPRSTITSHGGKLTVKVPTAASGVTANYRVTLNIVPGSRVNMYSGSTINNTYTASDNKFESMVDTQGDYDFVINTNGGDCDFIDVI